MARTAQTLPRPKKVETPYQKQLHDPRWKKLRNQVRRRDKWTCQQCGATRTKRRSRGFLHVHHKQYREGECLGSTCVMVNNPLCRMP
jgi:5-methylcytosine-specific restriction endonuclease McrA